MDNVTINPPAVLQPIQDSTGSTGNPGDVLTSQGDGLPPIWLAPGAALPEPEPESGPDPEPVVDPLNCSFVVDGLAVTLNQPTGTGSDRPIEVNWGDGSDPEYRHGDPADPAGAGFPCSHTFAAAGTYTITLDPLDDPSPAEATTIEVIAEAPAPEAKEPEPEPPVEGEAGPPAEPETEPETLPALFDPTEHTVVEATEYAATASPEELLRIYEAEQNGKNRASALAAIEREMTEAT
jgi:hypothetical protein